MDLANKTKMKAALVSLVASVIVLAIKTFAFKQTHSSAILSDALETIINVVTAAVALVIIYYANQPADKDHPYGHGKLEYFSAAFEGGMIVFASLMIFRETIDAYLNKHVLLQIEQGILLSLVATLINLIVGLYLLRIGRRENSETLSASGTHLLSDCWTTVGAIAGLVAVQISGLIIFDTLIALALAVYLLYSGIVLVKNSMNALIDGWDMPALENLTTALNKNRLLGIIDIHNVRSIRSGNFHHIDAHMVVPEFWDVKKVHELSHEFENKVVADYKYNGEFAFHVDPCKKSYCSQCEIGFCPIRQKEFVALRTLTLESIVSGPMPPTP